MQIDHSRNLIIKAVAVGLLIYLALPLVGQVPPTDRWIIAIVTALVGYLVGDLIILPKWGSTWAAVVDVFLIGGLILLTAMFLNAVVTVGGALMIGVIAGVVEWFFHLFLKQVPPNLQDGNKPKS